MNRLTKKCMVASAGMHALLILVLLVGPAFFSKKIEPMPPIITLVDAKITDGPTRGGGNPNIQEPPPPQPEPPVVQQQPPPAQEPEPEPVKPKPEVVKLPDPPKPEPAKPEPKPVVREVVKPEPKPEIKLKPVTKEADSKPKPADKPKPQPRQYDFSKVTRKETPKPTKQTSSSTKQPDISKELKRNLGNIASSIRNSTSSSTSVEMPGPGGEAFVNYRQLVAATYQRAYDQALVRVGEIGDRDDSVDVVVVIAKGGRVISSRITRNSGNPALNKLVRGVLDSINSVPGYPESAREAQRSFNIKFDLKSRRLTG